MELDRITLNFGKSEMPLAQAIRARAGVNGINALLKRIIREWFEAHKEA